MQHILLHRFESFFILFCFRRREGFPFCVIVNQAYQRFLFDQANVRMKKTTSNQMLDVFSLLSKKRNDQYVFCLRFRGGWGFLRIYENFKHFMAVLYLKKFELDFPAAFY